MIKKTRIENERRKKKDFIWVLAKEILKIDINIYQNIFKQSEKRNKDTSPADQKILTVKCWIWKI